MLRIVKTENGLVQGIPAADPRITAFKGIPFAAPPVGNLRWRAPRPARDWEGVFKACEFAPISMQLKPGLDPNNIYAREWNIDPEIPMSEDCLYLNVWTPAKSADEKLPVFVWYFGGGLQVGNTAEMEFDGERIARRGIVVVTVNYRVNVFGFLAHPELTAEAPEAPTNFGHLDQQFGTRWVKRNIAAFGGDPENITIGGQSAGGMSVAAQLVSPQNEGLFQKAILQSGFFMSPYGRVAMQHSLADAEEMGREFFELLGVKTLAEARRLGAEYIRDKSVENRKFWGTVDDGKFQIGKYGDTILKRRWPVPILFGRTTDEFIMQPKPETAEEFRAMALRFGRNAERFLALCHIDEGIEAANRYSAVSEIEVAIRTLCAAEDRAGLNIPKYYYLFGAAIPGWDDPGAFHSVDLWFFFETLAKCWRPFVGKHYDLARLMCNYWANFIKTGNPNGLDADGSTMPDWPSYKENEPNVMFFHEDKDKLGAKRYEPGELMKIFVDHMLGNQ